MCGYAVPENLLRLIHSDAQAAIDITSRIPGYAFRGTLFVNQLGSRSTATDADDNVSAGHTHCYVVTAVHSNWKKSAYSNEASAVIPAP